MRVPLSEEYLTMMLLDDTHTLPIRHQRYLVCQCILCAILFQGTIQRSILHLLKQKS
jgi:hypothetical protein